MRKGMKRYLITIIILLLVSIGGLVLYWLTDQRTSNQRFRTVKVERGEISTIITATGTINPVIMVLVGSQVSGTIKALYADFNSRVKEGQVIAQIDPAIFEAQVDQGKANLLTSQANLLNFQANLENARANLMKTEVSVLDTKRTLDRNRELMEKKVISQASLDTAQANYDSAVAQRESAKAQLESARFQLESGKAQVDQAKATLKLSETNLRYTTICSPVNGIVISRNVDVGQTVAASLQAPTLFTIAKDLTQMQVDTNVSEADIGRIVKGQEVTFTVDAYPEKTFRGRVSEIRNAPITIQNVVTYDVVLQVDNKDLRLKPGMTANVSIYIAHKEEVLKMPNAALRFQPGFAKQGGGPEKKSEGSAPMGRILIERLTKSLNLTSDQQSKVEMVLKASRQEFQEIREKTKPEEARLRIQNLIRQKIWGLLTEEQRHKFAELAEFSEREERKPGEVWVLSQEKKPIRVSILLGITDGTFSEVVAGDLRDGMEVILEETSKRKVQTKSPTSPPFTKGLGK
ncbi:MAG: efflux RND transporter periplasmic adaptor subunit [Thermodesulfobacteriota bacterium]